MKEKEDNEGEKVKNIIISSKQENDLEFEKEPAINIFFCSNKKNDYFSSLESLLKNSKKNLRVKGQYSIDSIVNELCYLLGIETKNHEEIDEKEIRNIVIFDISFKDFINILEIFIKKADSNIGNDEFPFFIFLRNQNDINEIDLKKLMLEINNFQKDIIGFSKLDSRNIYIDTHETVINTIKKIYNYYNGDFIINFDDNNKNSEKYNISKTINILLMGKRGCGKSTFINRILGEKRAFAHINAKTPKTREYYHGIYPIKLIDSAGFEVEGLDEKKTNEIKDIDKYLEEKNLTYKNIKKRVHFIFYLFRANDKLDKSVVQILKKFQSYNIEIFFIITYSKKGEEKLYKNNFKQQIKKNEIFPKEKINYIINNTFCIDSFDLNYSKTISEILLLISGKLKEYEESNNIIIEAIENYKNLIQTKDMGYIFDTPNELASLTLNNVNSSSIPYSSRSLSMSIDTTKLVNNPFGGKIFKKNVNNPKEILELVKQFIENNIFLTDFVTERETKKALAKEAVKAFKWPGFWWSSFTIPILNEYLAKKSKLKMLRRIAEIYGIDIPDNYDHSFFDSIKEKDGKFKKFIKTIGTWIAGAWNFKDVSIIGDKIIDEFDYEYAKKNILDLYLEMASNYNKSFQLFKNFYTCFNQDYWYDIRFNN